MLVVDVDLYCDVDGSRDWTAEWGLLDEQMVDEITRSDLLALVDHVLADARTRWGEGPKVLVQWSLHHDDGRSTNVTGREIDGVILPFTLT
ncbi:hypothetical protein [Nocardia brasiliensis]|uniref:hypothetical protein n=1 Tax=Nocardia brasiliensis TaxID=37326 RepID=UPI001895608B|nr:hypothetical protein [Nocardia brasiliensis]MBF6548847.1 hypothetical protein [Nocardia brasiliensis]